MKYCMWIFLAIIIIDLVNPTRDIYSTELKDFTKSEFASDERIRSEKPLLNRVPTAHLCFFSGLKTDKDYPTNAFTLYIEVVSLKKSFEIKTNLNEFIFELKETIRQRTGYRCDQQRLRLISYEYRKFQRNLNDGHKLGDYVTIINDTCGYKLKVYERNSNKNIQFNIPPNVTHYEYVMMSSHVYQPDERFLDGWNIIQYNPQNKYGLAFVIYANPDRHQCVISIRGTDLSMSIFDNLITDLRLLFTNQAIDTFDSARLLLFHDEPINIPRQDSIPYVISFTGHSLGAAIAESFACTYNSYAVTFDSPGTCNILNNDPSCRANIELGFNPKKQIHTYLGAYANLINVAHPQFGQVVYLKQFGVDNDADSTRFVYIYSSAASVYLAACIFANFVDKNMFKLGLWFTIGYFVKKSAVIDSLTHIFDLDIDIFPIFYPCFNQLPLLITIFLLCQLIGTLADMIEHGISQIVNRISPENRPILRATLAFIRQKVNFNRVIWRFIILSMYLIVSCLISIGLPLYCYGWWLASSHSINKFVESFNPNDGNPYKGQYIESTCWPTLFDYLTKTTSHQFLLILLIIQSIKLFAFHLFPPSVPKWVRLNLVLLLFARFFNIGSIECLIFIFILLFLFAIVPACQQDNLHYLRNILCAATGLLAIIEILNERHQANTFYCEIVGFLMVIVPFIKRLPDLVLAPLPQRAIPHPHPHPQDENRRCH